MSIQHLLYSAKIIAVVILSQEEPCNVIVTSYFSGTKVYPPVSICVGILLLSTQK